MVSVSVENADVNRFHDSVGMMGEFGSGRMLARDGKTVLENPIEFGQEWQTRPGQDPKLFQVDRAPQYPRQKCILPGPSSKQGRRLGETLARNAAEKACAHWNGQKELCVFDVMATGDLEVAGHGPYV